MFEPTSGLLRWSRKLSRPSSLGGGAEILDCLLRRPIPTPCRQCQSRDGLIVQDADLDWTSLYWAAADQCSNPRRKGQPGKSTACACFLKDLDLTKESLCCVPTEGNGRCTAVPWSAIRYLASSSRWVCLIYSALLLYRSRSFVTAAGMNLRFAVAISAAVNTRISANGRRPLTRS